MLKEIKTDVLTALNKEKDLLERRTRMILAFAFLASIIGMGRVLFGVDPLVLLPLGLMVLVSGGSLFLVFKYHAFERKNPPPQRGGGFSY